LEGKVNCKTMEDEEIEIDEEDPRDNPLIGEDDWIHDIEMGDR